MISLEELKKKYLPIFADIDAFNSFIAKRFDYEKLPAETVNFQNEVFHKGDKVRLRFHQMKDATEHAPVFYLLHAEDAWWFVVPTEQCDATVQQLVACCFRLCFEKSGFLPREWQVDRLLKPAICQRVGFDQWDLVEKGDVTLSKRKPNIVPSQDGQSG